MKRNIKIFNDYLHKEDRDPEPEKISDIIFELCPDHMHVYDDVQPHGFLAADTLRRYLEDENLFIADPNLDKPNLIKWNSQQKNPIPVRHVNCINFLPFLDGYIPMQFYPSIDAEQENACFIIGEGKINES